ncbi:MAG: C-type lectin domain-containing protein [Bacteroidota bacterium]
MNVFWNKISLLLPFIFLSTFCYGQVTLWEEDFESPTAINDITGNATGAEATSWSATGDTHNNSNRRFDVASVGGSQVMRARNTDQIETWATAPIDISTYANVVFTLDAGSLGVEGSDNFTGSYRIDTGAWIDFQGTTTTGVQSSYSVSGISGTTLEIRIQARTNANSDSEYYFIDNVLVQGDFVSTNAAPVLSAAGDQVYCPGTSIPVVETVSLTDMDDTTADEVSVQISSGYINGEDILTLTGSHPNIIATWSAPEGKLTLTGPALLTAFEAAIAAVEYSSSAMNPSGNRGFSITVGDPNFLPSTGHYYEFISDVGITWTDARDAAALRTYYGLQGYLVTLTSQEEADFSGSQATGVGWIGANDDTTEGDWQWVTGPEAGTSFWSGGVGGTELTFAFWNNNEPNDYPGGPSTPGQENFAHITDNSIGITGSWNDLPNVGGGGAYAPQGYIVEYGGTTGDPTVNVSASTQITIVPSIAITTQPTDQTVVVGEQATFTSAWNNTDTFQWQESTDGGVSFTNLVDDGIRYIGSGTSILAVMDVDLIDNGNQYRVIGSNLASGCGLSITSNAGLLSVRVRTVITNRRITYRVDEN